MSWENTLWTLASEHIVQSNLSLNRNSCRRCLKTTVPETGHGQNPPYNRGDPDRDSHFLSCTQRTNIISNFVLIHIRSPGLRIRNHALGT